MHLQPLVTERALLFISRNKLVEPYRQDSDSARHGKRLCDAQV